MELAATSFTVSSSHPAIMPFFTRMGIRAISNSAQMSIVNTGAGSAYTALTVITVETVMRIQARNAPEGLSRTRTRWSTHEPSALPIPLRLSTTWIDSLLKTNWEIGLTKQGKPVGEYTCRFLTTGPTLEELESITVK